MVTDESSDREKQYLIERQQWKQMMRMEKARFHVSFGIFGNAQPLVFQGSYFSRLSHPGGFQKVNIALHCKVTTIRSEINTRNNLFIYGLNDDL